MVDTEQPPRLPGFKTTRHRRYREDAAAKRKYNTNFVGKTPEASSSRS
jgi:hypothetical protein